MVEIKGKGGISAKIIADSQSDLETSDGARIVTYELTYPRFIHAEFMTHRMLSKNAASSRAIPVEKNIEQILAATAMPIHWGKNQPGMSAKEECNTNFEPCWAEFRKGGTWSDEKIDSFRSTFSRWSREENWYSARDQAIKMAQAFHEAGYHKQIVNRLLEPFTFMKVVATGTEFANLFHLRCHPDAQPEFQELARCMKEAYDSHHSIILEPGEWHVPYYGEGYWRALGDSTLGNGAKYNTDSQFNTLEDALMISASCCAQVSYRKNDDSIDKARDIYKRLVESKPMHASPFEHQATPMTHPNLDYMGEMGDEGATHHDGKYVWSGNLRGWIQNRQLIPGHVVW